jgi:Saxitoxin biosynthesis operon protein SxtJ
MTTNRHSEERRFGLSVGGIFLVLGAWWIFRGKFLGVAPLFVAAGLLLFVLGAAVPGSLSVPRRLWMSLASGLGFVMTRVVLLVVFAFVVTPIGVVRRLTGGDPLRRRTPLGESTWQPYPARHLDPKHYDRTF